MQTNYDVITIPVGDMAVNCYLIGNPQTKECVLIDTGCDANQIISSLGDYQPKAVLLTHGHFDHIGACDELCIKYNIPLYLHELDAPMLTDPTLNASATFDMPPMIVKTKPNVFTGGEELRLAGIPIQTMHTPGHTPGGACYLLAQDQGVFCGDTLFLGGYGRTDLPGGDFAQLRQSLRALLALSPKRVAYPGHGDKTTAGR